MSLACTCMGVSVQFSLYSSSDLVADVTVERVYPAETKYDKKFYKADLKYHKIFKGSPVKTVYVNGFIFVGDKRHGSWTSCSLGLKVGQRFILFQRKTVDGKYVLGYCDQRINYHPEAKKSHNYKDALEILKTLSYHSASLNKNQYLVDFNYDPETMTNRLDSAKGLTV